MPGRLQGSSVHLEIVVVGMLLAAIGFVVALLALLDAPHTPAPRLSTLDVSLLAMGGCLVVTGLGVVFETPWSWLPAIAFCGLLVSFNVWAMLSMAYVPWVLLQRETRELFFHRQGKPCRNPFDVALAVILTVTMSAGMAVARLVS